MAHGERAVLPSVSLTREDQEPTKRPVHHGLREAGGDHPASQLAAVPGVNLQGPRR
jgi:hypothetical protein